MLELNILFSYNSNMVERKYINYVYKCARRDLKKKEDRAWCVTFLLKVLLLLTDNFLKIYFY